MPSIRWTAALALTLLAGCLSPNLEGCAAREAEWMDPGLAAAVVADPERFGFDRKEPDGVVAAQRGLDPTIPFNGTVPGVLDETRLVMVGLELVGIDGIWWAGRQARLSSGFRDVPPAEAEALARAFARNVSALPSDAQDAWVTSFLANRTAWQRPALVPEGLMLNGSAYHAVFPGPYRLDALYAGILPGARVHAASGFANLQSGDWHFVFQYPYWEKWLGLGEESVAVDRAGNAVYWSPMGPEEARWFGPEWRFKRHIVERFQEEGLPEPSFEDFETHEPVCSESMRFED